MVGATLSTRCGTVLKPDDAPTMARAPICRSASTGAALSGGAGRRLKVSARRSEEHTSELQSLMRISYAVFCLKKKTNVTLEYTVEISSTNKNVHEHQRE